MLDNFPWDGGGSGAHWAQTNGVWLFCSTEFANCYYRKYRERKQQQNDIERGLRQPRTTHLPPQIPTRESPRDEVHFGAKIKVVTYDREKMQNKSDPCCAICLADFEDGDNCGAIEPCQHMYHRECIETWLKQWNPRFPCCRGSIPSRTPAGSSTRSITLNSYSRDEEAAEEEEVGEDVDYYDESEHDVGDDVGAECDEGVPSLGGEDGEEEEEEPIEAIDESHRPESIVSSFSHEDVVFLDGFDASVGGGGHDEGEEPNSFLNPFGGIIQVSEYRCQDESDNQNDA
ncbi:hypothetical protein SLEP1_g41440 [Rubroshorea leprosula]|uniref:RING-type domain-containing protein n=1 Tax=Rubroshorea leprosula TaxID=152421 RepID=A0AAV5L6K4_9ROSI|nr:hypothetical protein SLEP1_g41440 [Rubroshorea leprosula]